MAAHTPRPIPRRPPPSAIHRTPFRPTVLALVIPVMLLAGCWPDPVDYTGKSCPCGSGWVCDPTERVCRRERADAGPRCSVLLVVQASVENSADPVLEERIRAVHDCEVRVMEHAEVQVEDSVDQHLIVISSTVESGVVGGLFRGSAQPVITWEAFVYPDLGMTDVEFLTDFGFTDTQVVTIEAPSHPLAAGLEGTVPYLSAPGAVTWALPAGEGATVATVGGMPGIFYFRPGDRTVAERAIGCRIGLTMWDDSAKFFTVEGWALFDAAVQWALDGCP